MNDRFITKGTPIAKKYRRVIEGLELGIDPLSSTNGTPRKPQSSDPQSIQNRQSVYRSLFGAQIADSSPVGSVSSSSSSFLELQTNTREKRGSSTDANESPTTSSSFIAPILYGKKGTRTTRRPLQSSPIKILDAPGLEDDFYLNLLDWEIKSNRVSVLLGGTEVYFWNAANLGSTSPVAALDSTVSGSLGRVKHLDSEKGCVIKWSPTGSASSLLAIGTKNGLVEIWDAEKSTRIHSWSGHNGMRCGVLSWNGGEGGQLLSSGGRDHRIIHYDLRSPQGIIAGITAAHTQEVCGLKYDHYGTGLLASGGNDNQLLVWDRRRDVNSGPLLQLNQHCAAVKAIDWSPHQAGLLASGGGTADRTIRFWNTKLPSSANVSQNRDYSSLKPIQVSSQVCTLAWSPLAPNEILSTHGFSEHNLALWSYPTGQCLGTLDGHSQRVLFQAVGPDGSTVVTGSGDETLRFWSVFRRPAANDQLNGINRRSNRNIITDRASEHAFQTSR